MTVPHKPIFYDRRDEIPIPDELKFRNGTAINTVTGASPSNGNSNTTLIETVNSTGATVITHGVTNPSDNKLDDPSGNHVTLLTRQVRCRHTGAIIPINGSNTVTNVYNWTKRSITLLNRSTTDPTPNPPGATITYPTNVNFLSNVAIVSPNNKNGLRAVNRAVTIHFPYDVEIYDPANPK